MNPVEETQIKTREDGVSIVIASYNSGNRIAETLESLAKQEVGNVPTEIIFVDNNSNDGTSQIVEKVWSKLGDPIPLKTLFHEIPGVMEARLRGFAECRYRIAVLCDDDNHLARNYISKVYELFADNPALGVVGGISYPDAKSELPDWLEDYSAMFACGDRGLERGRLEGIDAWVWGAGMALRLDVFDRLVEAGFRNRVGGRTGSSLLSGEDVEWCHWFDAVGYEIHFEPELQLTHFIEDRKLTDEYLMNLKEGIKVSGKRLADYYSLLRGLEIRRKRIYAKPLLLARILAKMISGKDYQPEVVASMPSLNFLMETGVRDLCEYRERFLSKTREG